MGRLRSLRLQPPHDPGPGVRERVDAADAGPRDVPGHEVISLAVELGIDLAFEDQVRLLVRVVVAPGEPARLVLHHEHREELRAEVGVDHHLHGDAAIDEERRPHARRNREHVLRLLVHLHVGGVDMAERARARIAHVDRRGLAVGRSRDRVGVTLDPRAWLRSPHRRPSHGRVGDVAERVGHPDRRHAVIARSQQVRALARVDHELPFEHVDAVLVAVDVPGDAPTARELDDREPGVHGARHGLVDHRPPPEVPGPRSRRSGELELVPAPDQMTRAS